MKNKKCIWYGCNSSMIYSRGLCRNHYVRLHNLVRNKKTRTWEELELGGYALGANPFKKKDSI